MKKSRADEGIKQIDLHESEWTRDGSAPRKVKPSPWNWYITDWYDVIAAVLVIGAFLFIVK
jgi:hypothetical protein